MAAPNDIVFYQYTFSPYAKRVADYLALRGIAYAQCLQPPILPRPDLELLNVHYRRIPLLAIGNHVYADTRLILRKLEAQFPQGKLGADKADQRAIERLLSRWTTEAGIFTRATQLIPAELPLLKDPKFQKDRGALMGGRDWSAEGQKKGRPEAIVHVRELFEDLEQGLLADGRDWILKTDKPSLADIEAAWPVDWLTGMKGALPEDIISEKTYPKVFAWIARYKKAVKAAREKSPKPTTVKGQQAAELVIAGKRHDTKGGVDSKDPLGLAEGTVVSVKPTDYGFTHKDVGPLRQLNKEDVAIEVETKTKGKTIWLHFPRFNFRVQKDDGGSKL